MKDYWCSAIGLLMLGDCSIELIEETEDEQREVYWIQELDCVNQCRMKFGYKDTLDYNARQQAYRKANSSAVRRNARAWRAKNKDRINAQRRLSRPIEENQNNPPIICDRCGGRYSYKGMARHQRTQKCKDTAAGKVLKAKRCICELCGTEYADGHRHRHQRTKKCQTLYAAKCEK